jgi:hypothetical protein
MGVVHAGQILAPASRDPRGAEENVNLLHKAARAPAPGSFAIFAAIRRASSLLPRRRALSPPSSSGSKSDDKRDDRPDALLPEPADT